MSGIANGAVRLARRSSSGRGLALVYHRIADVGGNEERELVPAIATRTFEWQVRHLRTHYQPVTASGLPAAARGRRRGEPFPVAITFDDDYASHRQTAMPSLLRSGVPATFFLGGGPALDRPFFFWWEMLQQAADRGIPLESLLGNPDASSWAAGSSCSGQSGDRSRGATKPWPRGSGASIGTGRAGGGMLRLRSPKPSLRPALQVGSGGPPKRGPSQPSGTTAVGSNFG